MIREMFAYAKEHEPCIIFMDEIDAIGGRRFSEGTSADREIQRTLMEVSRKAKSRRRRDERSVLGQSFPQKLGADFVSY
jgi:SpoVK/Ycf46/Vps4 family AAA+-type ATPase